MAMLLNNIDELFDDDLMDELFSKDWPVLDQVDDDTRKPRPSNFQKIYKENFLKKYKEIDDAIRKDDLNYLLKLKSWETVNLSDDPLLNVVITYEKSDLALRLLESEKMSESHLKASNIYGETALHAAATMGNERVGVALVKKCKELIEMTNNKLENPLHNAALSNQRRVFWRLLDLECPVQQMTREAESYILQRRRGCGTNILHYAIMGNAPDLALEIAMTCPELITSRNTFAATPLHFVLTITEAFKSELTLGFLDSIIYTCIPLNKYTFVHAPKKDQEESEIQTDEEKQSGLKFPPHCSTLWCLLKWIYQFLGIVGKSVQKGWEWIVFRVLMRPEFRKVFGRIRELQEMKQNHRQTIELIAFLARNPDYWDLLNKGGSPNNSTTKIFYTEEEQGTNMKKFLKKLVKFSCKKKKDKFLVRWNESPLIIGAKLGFYEFVKQILENSPQSTSHLDTEGMNVLQVAIKYGQKKITELILSKASGKNPIIPSVLLSSVHQETGNTILHFAAEKTAEDEGFVLQMQYELQWFEKVKKKIPEALRHCRNYSEQTAEELFSEKHECMVKNGKQGIMDLGKTCSGLVAAVVFASTFSIPGDKDANQNPIFLHKTAFKVFSHAYAIGLSSAATSLVLFLSLLTTPYKEQDFRRALPAKYFCSITSFLIALVALLVAFSCNIYLQIYGGKRAETWDIFPFVCELTVFPTVCLLVVLNRSHVTGVKYFLRHFWR